MAHVDAEAGVWPAASGRWSEEPEDMAPERFPPTRETYYMLPPTGQAPRGTSSRLHWSWTDEAGDEEAPEVGVVPELEERALLYREPGSLEKAAAVDRFAALSHVGAPEDMADEEAALPMGAPGRASSPPAGPMPAWLKGDAAPGSRDGAEQGRTGAVSREEEPASGRDTLQSLREQVASKRFSARAGTGTGGNGAIGSATALGPKSARIPLLTVFSLAGGVGKTSLVAALGRALAAAGERVLLADTTLQGLLSFYYAVNDLEPSVVRTLCLPAEAQSAEIDLLSLDVLGQGQQAAGEWLRAELSRSSEHACRILLDTSMIAPWTLRLLARIGSRILVPLAPDMNSVLTLSATEGFFAEIEDDVGQAVQPVYLLNGFDASQPLHLDVRELLGQTLGERLLPFVIRRSAAVAEALAEGMTVIDYAVGTPVAEDYRHVAEWVRSQAGGMTRSSGDARWSEA